MIRALLIHSPLVGPATMRPLAGALQRRDWETIVPDLRHSTGSLDAFAAAAGVHEPSAGAIVIGHSGAGAVLPSVAAAVDAIAIVFIDAVVPAPDAYGTAEAFTAFLDTLSTDDGLLPPWNDWWSPDLVAELLPDRRLREEIVSEMPRLHRGFYRDVVASPPGWRGTPCGYVQLSPAYDAERETAALANWPIVTVNGKHLDVAARPDVVADAVVRVVEFLGFGRATSASSGR